MTKTSVRNITVGIRGLNTVDGYRDLAPGELVESVELDEAERKSADSTGYFEFGAKAKAAPAAASGATAPAALPRNAPKLKKLARDEGIDVGEAKTVDALVAAIETGRAAKTAGGIPPTGNPPADDLDNMSDDDLRNTVAALTGKPVTDYTDTERVALLKLARGE